MSHQMPGAFPSTPRSNARAFDQKTPTAADFKFTPISSMSGVKKPLYPNISHLQQGQGNELEKEFQDLGYSNTLSTKVLSELNERAASKAPTSNTGNNVLSPRSTRYNPTHRSRFQKMESISSHYAAARRNKAKLASSGLDRQEIEVDKENIPSYAPHSKRTGVSEMASATKRRKTEVGAKEIRSPFKQTLSPSKGQTNLSKILNSAPQPPREIKQTRPVLKPLDRKPLKISPSISNLSKPLPRSSTTASMKTYLNPTVSSLKSSTSSKHLSRSSTLNNLTKPTAASISKSSTTHNLAQTLHRKPSSTNLQESVSRIPRSKSTINNKNARPSWR